MLKDALTELHAASHVDVVKEVAISCDTLFTRVTLSPVKLYDVLDIACFRDVGNRINETVW